MGLMMKPMMVNCFDLVAVYGLHAAVECSLIGTPAVPSAIPGGQCGGKTVQILNLRLSRSTAAD